MVEYAGFSGTWPDFNTTYEPLPYVKEPYTSKEKDDPHGGVEWCRGVLDMAEAVQENRPQRITGAQAAHVVDIVCGIQEASLQGRRVEITSEFPQTAPMDWAK
jgi:predicted dehydrogenase